MGSWGPGSFQNDGALDWLAELRDVATVRDALRFVADAPHETDFDVDEGEWTLAAEIVAAARSQAARHLAEQARAFLEANAKLLTAADAKLARRAIVRITTDPCSELRSLRAVKVTRACAAARPGARDRAFASRPRPARSRAVASVTDHPAARARRIRRTMARTSTGRRRSRSRASSRS